jgi:hypothetical protein
MSGVARWRFVNLTEDEIVGLHAYLSTGVDNRSIAPPPSPGN